MSVVFQPLASCLQRREIHVKFEWMIYLFIGIFSYLIGLSSLIAFFWILEFGFHRPLLPFDWLVVLRNTLLFLPFPLQHSVLPRRQILMFLEKRFGAYMIRPFYVGTSGVLLWLIVAFWKPFGPVLYSVHDFYLLDIVFGLSLLMILYSTMQLDHTALFGLKQARAAWKQEPLPQVQFKTEGIFSQIRHPITSGLLIALWSHDTFTADRLLMNVLFTAYALIGTVFEEKSMIESWGKKYLDYRHRVPAFIPGLRFFASRQSKTQ